MKPMKHKKPYAPSSHSSSDGNSSDGRNHIKSNILGSASRRITRTQRQFSIQLRSHHVDSANAQVESSRVKFNGKAPAIGSASPSSNSRKAQPVLSWSTHSDAESGSSYHITGNDNLQFDVKLYRPFKNSLDLPLIDGFWEDDRWVLIKTQFGRDYKVHIKKKHGWYALCTGWEIVVALERLIEEEIVHFEYTVDGHFLIRTNHSAMYNLHSGFSQGFELSFGMSWTSNDYLLGTGTKLTAPLTRSMYTLWSAAANPSVMYACTIRGSQITDGSMFFSTEYSKLLPEKKRSLALRLIGSPVIISASIRRYKGGVARITRGWTMFVKEHNIVEGDKLIFRCHHGPNSWELLAIRSLACT